MFDWFSTRAAAMGDQSDLRSMADIATPWLVDKPKAKMFDEPPPDVDVDLSAVDEGDRSEAAWMIRTLRDLQNRKAAVK